MSSRWWSTGRAKAKRRLRQIAGRLGARASEETSAHVYELNVTEVDRLAGKTAIVTGGGGSIGSAICYRLAVEGARVGIAGRTPETITRAMDQIVAAGVAREHLSALVMDVTDESSVASAVESFVARHGRLDILVNNAGGSARGRESELADQDMTVVEDIVDLNLLGPLRCCKYSIPHLRETSGRVINFGSTVGYAGQRSYVEYAAAKSGIIGLTKALALELGEFGVTVNTVTPGWVWRNAFDGEQHRPSDRTALRRYGTPEEVAGLVAYLCTDSAGYLTGNDFKVDGGRTLGLMKE